MEAVPRRRDEGYSILRWPVANLAPSICVNAVIPRIFCHYVALVILEVAVLNIL